MSVHITSDNLSKFNKRLHKALKEVMGDTISLSQSAELMARATGFKTLHDLQMHLLSDQSPSLPSPIPKTAEPADNTPNSEWIEKITADIAHYASTHPHSTIRQWSWTKSNGTYALQIESNDAAFGLFFGEDVVKYVDKELAHVSATAEDQNFIRQLAARFPIDPIEGQKLGLDVAQQCKLPLMRDGWSSIARHPKYTTQLGEFPVYQTVANLGEAVQDFVIMSPDDFVASVGHSQRNYVDISGLKTQNVFASWTDAVQYVKKHPELLIVQRVRQIAGHKVWSGFYATAEQYAVHVKSVNGDPRAFSVGYTNDVDSAYDTVRCQGFLAALHKLPTEHNPYGCNEIQHQLWNDGFEFARTYPLREQFWIKPPR